MSSLLDVDVSDAQEPIAVPAGTEAKLRIIGCNFDKNKNDEDYILPRFEIVGEPLAKDFTKYLGIPHTGMDEKQLARAKWALKSFYDCFGIDSSKKLNPEEDFIGLEGWAILGLENNPEYGEQNYIKKFVAGK